MLGALVPLWSLSFLPLNPYGQGIILRSNYIRNRILKLRLSDQRQILGDFKIWFIQNYREQEMVTLQTH